MKVEYTREDDGYYTGAFQDVEKPWEFRRVSRAWLVELICDHIKAEKPKRVAVYIDGSEKPLYLHGNTVKSIIEGKRTFEDFIVK